MNEGWTTSRVITVFLLGLILVTGWWILMSLDRQQEKIIEVGRRLDQIKTIQLRIDGPQKIVVEHTGNFMPVPLPLSGGASPGTAPRDGQTGTSPSATAPQNTTTVQRAPGDGKDEIGRPRRPTPGFTMEPAPGVEIPGRTIARNPDVVPPLGGTYVHCYTSEPDKINHYLTNDGLCSRYDRLVHQRLFTINPDDPQILWPELAVAWETSDDQLSYRFHLRRGVSFSDGSPFAADDVLFSYNTAMDDDVQAEHIRSSFDDVESVRAIDPFTVEVRMRRKYWKALRQFGYTLRMLPREYYEREIPKMAEKHGITSYSVRPKEPGFGEIFNKFTRDIAPGTGAYMWREGESWVSTQHFTLYPFLDSWVRRLNPDFYRIEKIKVRFVKDRIAQHEEFRKGTIDVLVVGHDKWDDTLSKDPTITDIANHYEYDHLGLMYSLMIFNCRQFPFDDVNVRRAMAHLMDRQAILDNIEKGRGQIAVCPTKPVYREYSHDIEPRLYDPALARKILQEAGWKDTDGDGILDRNGRALEFKFSVPSGRTFYTTISNMLEESCRSVGIRCSPDPKGWALFMEEIDNLSFNIISLYFSASDPWKDPYEEFHSSQAGPRAGNYAGWANADVDRLLEAMRAEFDDDKRAEMFHQLNHHFHDEVPWLLLMHSKVGVLLNKRIRGAKIRPTGLQDFDMWIDPESKRG